MNQGALFSDEARVMIRPFHTYREIARAPLAPSSWLLVQRPLAWLLFIACFVSLTGAGRLVLPHIVSAMIAWAFVPLFQIGYVALATRIFSGPTRISIAVDRFYIGQAPWLLFLLLLAAVCLFAPDVWAAFQWLLESRTLFIAAIATTLWSMLLTLAFFRSGLVMSKGTALAATAAYYLAFASTIILYYVAAGQLLPLLLGAA